MTISGKTKIIGFIGSTYEISPIYATYNDAFKSLNLDYVYVPFAVKDLQSAVDGIKNLGIHAVGVTIPYKVSIIPYLDQLEASAERAGAVNVVINRDGCLIGANTDGEGAKLALEEVCSIENKNILILGAGGAARSVIYSLKQAGANIIILNRTVAHAKVLAEKYGCQYDCLEQLAAYINDSDIIMNLTSVGMLPNSNKTLVDKQLLQAKHIVFDTVNKPVVTQLISDAKTTGCRVITGDRMLALQAKLKFKYYTGVTLN